MLRRSTTLGCAALLALSLPAPAQDTQEERDRGFLTALIEDNLEAPGLSVRIDGFEGALSSEASLDALTVSDDAGPWLRLEDVVLDWNRSALFRGRLEVSALTAALIQMDRAPLPAEGVEALPDAGSSGLSIPDLPVAIEIGLIRADRIELGAPLLGQPLAMTLEARAQLADGSADVALIGERLDGVAGRFDIDAAFEAPDQRLTLDLSVVEEAGGIAATLLQLPGAPAISLTVAGAGPLDAFAADVALASEGQDRLSGQVTLDGVEAGQQLTVDLGGDLSPLLAPRYQPFFGTDTTLAAQALLLSEGGTRLEDLNISTEALSLTGAATIGADGWPSVLDIDGTIAAADGTPVVLPTADAPSVQSVRFAMRHDAAQSEDWALDLTVDTLRHPVVDVQRADVSARGQLQRDGGTVTGAVADLSLSGGGLVFADPALADAVGSEAEVSTKITWSPDAPIRLDNLRLRGPALAASGDLAIATDGSPLAITLDLAAQIVDLRRLAALTGQADLAGQADLSLSGGLGLGGAFDLTAEGRVADLRTGISQADGLLAGATDIAVTARRNETGTFLDQVTLDNPQLGIAGRATLLAEDAPARNQGNGGEAVLDVRLADGALLDPRLAGAVSAQLDLSEQAGIWSGTAALRAPQGVAMDVSGALTGPAPDVDLTLTVPDLEPFAPGVPGSARVRGRAFAREGVWSVDAALEGPYDLTAQIAGPVTGNRPEITYSARLPDASAAVPALASVPPLAGPVTLQGTLAQEGAAWVTDTRVTAPEDVTIRARGPVTGPAVKIDVAATVPRVEAFVPTVSGTLSLHGTLRQMGDDWAVTARATGPYEARATVDTILTETPLAVDFSLRLPRLADVAPGVPGGLDLSGRAVQEAFGWRATVEGTGPYDAALTATARLPEAGPEVTLSARVPNARAIAPQLSGPLTLGAQAQQRDGIWSVEADAAGPFGATVTANARLPETGAEVRAEANLPNAAALAPQLRGPLRVVAEAAQRQGVWRAEATANGPFGANLDLSGIVAGAPLDLRVDLAVPDIEPIAGDISGPLRVIGTVAQPGTDYRVDLRVDGPSGTRADVAGGIAPNGTLDLAVQGSAPLGLANAGLTGQRLSGTAAFDLTVAGAPSVDAVRGTIRTSDAAVSLPTLGNALDPIAATVTLGGGRAQVDARAELQTGGIVTISGPVALTAPFDADLRAQFGVILQDPRLYTAAVEGDLALTGPLTGGAVLSGLVSIEEAEIVVPSSGLTAIGDLPPVQHLYSPRPVRRSLALAGLRADGRRAETNGGGGGGASFGLDLVVRADGRIFVRGRGLDAELGGQLRVTGTTIAPVTAGAFELVRGRLDILEQRFNLDEGTISFQGDLTPYVRLVAITEADALTASIAVEGPADDIGVTFSSTPDVPQEEILAQIFFGRGLDQLSPLQALQLANSVAVLAGRGSGGLLDNLRGSAGLDDLDITTDAEGNTAVRAGKYVSDNVYTDIQVDGSGDATISLNLDLTPNLTVRGSAGANGESSLGIFFEKDY
ncbi:hypothetical protein JANAI62_34250 [Jannaschia pagri]|uniref:Translocation and assembly module TamB C-terminal domain-containing protein n=1 Tax=Jannaschia pagri TaxID=2829797 RepID=A0ABQ4NQV8_9RHOB|nr:MULTISPECIES: translocation/assembly module TamB domain-containing protein [unclassified Jannaschia]GIT92967.1 hypothetical protein JANAI61_34250 [Jannaschia sp. AI_61]GIT96802.1 hypothetical protein JANAI62_34250 [Jannaschia sp. AI_62]